jgi:phosphohistidine phosphatase
MPGLILSSCASRAQETSDMLSEILGYTGRTNYLQELYYTPTDVMKEILLMLDDEIDTVFVIGHNPQLTDMVNLLVDDHIAKIPTMGVVAINFDITQWSDLSRIKGELDFFIYPKQFKYYVPKQIRAVLELGQ